MCAIINSVTFLAGHCRREPNWMRLNTELRDKVMYITEHYYVQGQSLINHTKIDSTIKQSSRKTQVLDKRGWVIEKQGHERKEREWSRLSKHLPLRFWGCISPWSLDLEGGLELDCSNFLTKWGSTNSNTLISIVLEGVNLRPLCHKGAYY